MPGPTGQRFEIAALDDFRRVPKDRLPKCLADFALVIQMYDAVDADVQKAGYRAGPLSGFEWTDDGVPMGEMHIHTPGAHGQHIATVGLSGSDGPPHRVCPTCRGTGGRHFMRAIMPCVTCNGEGAIA